MHLVCMFITPMFYMPCMHASDDLVDEHDTTINGPLTNQPLLPNTPRSPLACISRPPQIYSSPVPSLYIGQAGALAHISPTTRVHEMGFAQSGTKGIRPQSSLGLVHPEEGRRNNAMGLRTPGPCKRPLRGQGKPERRTSTVFHRFPPTAERLGPGGWTLTRLPPQPAPLDTINVPRKTFSVTPESHVPVPRQQRQLTLLVN